MNQIEKFALLMGCLLSIALGGCTGSLFLPVHTYYPPANSPEEKEEVTYPLNRDNMLWIIQTRLNASFRHSPKDRYLTPHGVVFHKIQCVPVDQPDAEDSDEGKQQVTFAPIEHLSEEELERLLQVHIREPVKSTE